MKTLNKLLILLEHPKKNMMCRGEKKNQSRHKDKKDLKSILELQLKFVPGPLK